MGKKEAGDKAMGAATIDLGTMHFKEANSLIRQELERSDFIELRQVFAQRYIGVALPEGKHLSIRGVPGNDMACYLAGGSIEVFGNTQDQIGNTMDAGSIIVHGRCGDAAGYGMRGGKIFIRDDCGWRVGIHMKQYGEKCPVIVIGGNAGGFLGEYMAGGIILLLGSSGKHMGVGMHGGVIYTQNRLLDEEIAGGLLQEPVDEKDIQVIEDLLEEYNKIYKEDNISSDACASDFYRLRAPHQRPYQAMYAH